MGIDYSLVPNEVQTEHINTLEKAKFFVDADGYLRIRTSAEGKMQIGGLQTAGRITKITLTDGTWVALPTTPLPGRNTLAIQNKSNFNISIIFDYDGNPNTLGAVYDDGWELDAGGEFFFDASDDIVIWTMPQTGSTPTIKALEAA